MPKISTKHQVTVPVTTLEEAGLRAGDQVVIEALGEGEVRIRRGALDGSDLHHSRSRQLFSSSGTDRTLRG
ncbi:MAG TPA: AbrB/MazE/SpoVT family DNA-binding domain-containing protein [Solirubrobacterales bacterium]|nr:AbrB/MazE/SpoVT family DNA-binding domain-containing protein [Solirubrobacterales bacterium]